MGRQKQIDTSWLDKALQHVEAVSRYLMVNLHFEEAQLDEFWSFVKKKEARCTALEKLRLLARINISRCLPCKAFQEDIRRVGRVACKSQQGYYNKSSLVST